MKIVHTEASCGWGGQEIRIIEESLGMVERGHEVTLLCPLEARIHQEAVKRGLPVQALPIARKNLRGLLALRRWLLRHQVDVLNTHSSTDTWLAALACQTLRHAPALVRTRHISAPVPRNLSTRWLYGKASRHIVTTGEALRRELIAINDLPGERLTSVPTGIDTGRFAPGDTQEARQALGLPQDRHYLGIVATLRSWKGHLYLLDAFAASAPDNWTLLIIGDGPMRNIIEEKIETLGLGGRVKLVGQQDKPELWLKALDLFCLPSYANEGVPQAILQAMLTALPIVTTPVGAILEAVKDGETALVVPPKDSTALAAALRKLMNDPELAATLGMRARETAVGQFSREIMLDRMERVFHDARSA
jgi:glycosyltransferase involved in cell wall biosynthesis